jgi:hypothetical protein
MFKAFGGKAGMKSYVRALVVAAMLGLSPASGQQLPATSSPQAIDPRLQRPPGEAPKTDAASDAPPQFEFQRASPATATYTPGEGLTVSMLNGTSTVKLFANFSGIATFSTTRQFPTGPPLFLFPASVVGANTNTFDLAARQSAFGGSFSGPEFCGLTPGGYFFGYIQNDNLTTDAYGLLPFQAYGDLKSEHWRFAAGLQSDVFNPVIPTMIPVIGLYDSGNTGSFRGQIRLEYFLKPSDECQLTFQLAASKPISTAITGREVTDRRITESNGWPNIEARVATGFGEMRELAGGRESRPVTIGVSGLVGQLRDSTLNVNLDPNNPLNRSTINVWGVGADVSAAVTHSFGFSGELFLGQSLGQYNGMIGQSFNSETLAAVRGVGGFGEAYFYILDNLHVHTGYGIDAPVIRDLAADQIARNQTYYANIFWDITKSFQWSFEVQYRQTDYVTLNDANGAVFLTQFLWRF